MRIGFLTYGMATDLTGIGRYTVELTRALAELDPRCEIVLLNPYPDSSLSWYRSFAQHPVPALKRVPMVATIGNLVLHRAAEELRLDVLHDPCGIAPFLAPRGRYRRVTTVHDLVPLLFPRTQPMATHVIFRTLVPLARYTADAIATVSLATATDLVQRLRFPAEKIWVTPNGFRPRPRLPAADAAALLREIGVREPYLLTVGAISPRKNVDRVVSAFRTIRARFPEASLVVAGPTYWDATGAARTAAREPGVQVTGFVPETILQALYERAAALVYVSLYEGFGLPVLEAMAAGTAVIVSSTPALKEVAGEAGIVVDARSVEQLGGAMASVLADDGARARSAAAGPPRAATYTWQETARRTLDLYHAIA